MRRGAVRSSLPVLLAFDPDARTPLFRQLYEQLRRAILAGRIRAGEALPSTRTLAAELGIARNTAKSAFDQLLAEGYLVARVGSGTRVAAGFENGTARDVPHATRRRAARRAIGARAAERVAAPDYPSPITQRTRAFRLGLPALDRFPAEAMARLAGRRWRRVSPAHLSYGDGRGERPLREAIASHLGVLRGVRCDPDQVLVVGGSQGGLDLAARMLIRPGDRVWVEDPGYFGARASALAARATLVPAPVDDQGLDVAAARRRAPRARAAFTTPSHQFPLGPTLSLPRRLALLRWARAARAWIIEDDYDSEFRYDARPLMALRGLDRDDRVLYVGTFSKTLSPALRIGYLVLPADLVEPFVKARAQIDQHGPRVDQLVLADFIAEGHYARHLRRMRSTYAERQAALVAAIREQAAGLMTAHASGAGLHIVAWLAPGHPEARVAEAAARRGVAVMPLGAFRLERRLPPGLVLGYGATTPGEIREGVRALAAAIREARVRRGGKGTA